LTVKTEATTLTEDLINTEITGEPESKPETTDEVETESRAETADEAELGDEAKTKCREQREENECGKEDLGSDISGVADDENKSTLFKLFVHSQWLAVQSPYFKALFYSGMKETYCKEVVMKIYEHELEAHKTLIEAMYKFDALSDKDYHLVVQVLVLAHKYDVRNVVKKCKYVLLSTTPNLEMCEYIAKETEHLSDTADIYDMLEKFLVKEFTPIDDTWTLEKFTSLSKAALRLLLRSDDLGTRSENTIFVALMKWVRTTIPWFERQKCDLLDLVRFQFMSIDFLYDVVRDHYEAQRMPGFNKYFVEGLAYHGFSSSRREQLEPKPKERLVVNAVSPAFSWVIDEKMDEQLSTFPESSVYSDKFWYLGYPMELQLSYSKDLRNCGIYLCVLNLKGGACLSIRYTAKSNLFTSGTVKTRTNLFTAEHSAWGRGTVQKSTQKGNIIDVYVEII
jgi:hypothetical protein